jgi:Cellulase (glycosyl hydrolase family 5)
MISPARFRAAALLAVALLFAASSYAQRRIPKDLSGVRGFNYQSAPTTGHTEHWLQYSAAETERDFDFAKRLQLNQVRVFVPYAAWVQDKEAFRKNLLHLVRAAHQRGVGVMPTLQYERGVSMDKNRWPSSKEFVADLIATLGKEPGLAFWDVSNEPDCCALPPTPANRTRMEHAVYMAKMFRELDAVTPVTIGATFSENMIEMGEAQDVLSFHNYLPTRAAIRADIAKAKAYAAKVNKPLINTEIGCIARANPYDVTLEEHMKAKVGWYIWELMITHQWGTVHGVFHPNGTIRDPSIVAALFGMFRDADENVMPAAPDREGAVTRAVANNRKWLADANAGWDAGLDLAEISANLLEAGELIAIFEPPARKVDLLRRGAPDLAALRAVVEKYTAILEPFQLPPDDPRRGRPPSTLH